MKEKMRRLSVSLDEESLAIVNEFLSKANVSKAELIREALNCLRNMKKATKEIPLENIWVYINCLAKMEHVIVDIAYLKAIFSEIGEGSEEFWNEVYKIGEEHMKEYYSRGMRDVKQILEYVENANYYTLNIDSENSYTLILTVSEASKFVKTFLEGCFNNYPRKVEISEEHKKIRIRVV